MSCCCCAESFDEVEHVPVIGSCGHSLCAPCIFRLETVERRTLFRGLLRLTSRGAACPLCQTRRAFRPPLKRNYQMLDLIAEQNEISRKNSVDQSMKKAQDLSVERMIEASRKLTEAMENMKKRDASKITMTKLCSGFFVSIVILLIFAVVMKYLMNTVFTMYRSENHVGLV